uniref:Alternative protein EPB41L1 n=1 Tax=Homo sapiens TaxID=9606 RepID=L8E750_HUMAN|nr:alternative protein EPB41L1 [Homo sapiens]
MSNITRNNFFFQKHLNNQLRCCPVPFYSHPSLLSRPHAPPPQCSVLYACALCSCILNISEINVFDAEP